MSSIIREQIKYPVIIGDDQIIGTKYDYSSCSGRMAQYAFISPTNGEITVDGEKLKIADHRTLSRYQEYKDCGFDVMLLLPNDRYEGEEFMSSDLKMNLDLCHTVGLKTVVCDGRLHDMTMKKESLIGTQFDSFDKLVDWVRDCMNPYMTHPSFYGVTLYDEPRFQHLAAVGEVTRAVKAVCPKAFVHTCLLPYFASVDYGLLDFRTSLGPDADPDTTKEYKKYITTHLENTGADYVAYDNYPIFYSNNETWICFTYFHNLQMVANVANKFNARIDLTIQTYADTNTEMRLCDGDDVRFQAYAALAFGAKNVSYFTYFMFPHVKSGKGICQAIMDMHGNKLLYYETQSVNAIAQKVYKVTENFRYAGTNFACEEKDADLFEKLVKTDFDTIKNVTAAEPLLINRLYDYNRNVEGFMLVNASDPARKLNNVVKLELNGKTKAIVYVDGNPIFAPLKDGVLDLNISCGDGVFIIPIE